MSANTAAIIGVWGAFALSLVSEKITNNGSFSIFVTAVGLSVLLGL